MNGSPFYEIDKFIKEVDQATDLGQIVDILKEQVQRLGFEYFTYWLLWPSEGPRRPLYLTNYPGDWTEHYLEYDFKSHDVVGNFAARSFRPFIWSDLKDRIVLTPYQQRVFNDAYDIGLKAGGSIPLHGPKDAKAAFSVCDRSSDIQFRMRFLEKRHELQLIAGYAHEKIMMMGLERAPIDSVHLTPREIEVLVWTAKGKTKWEIGELLSISEETVKKHMFSACNRLEASNKTHAVAVALLHGLIIP